MQILLASAKIMRDKPVQAARITTTEPRFNDEARTLALDMSQYDTADIAEMLNCSPKSIGKLKDLTARKLGVSGGQLQEKLLKTAIL